MSSAMARGVSAAEISKFSRLQKYWWCPQGPLRTLHQFNPVRVEFINKACRCAFTPSDLAATAGIRPGMSVLDVGCGGGILSESIARLGGDVLGIDMCKESIAVAEERRQRVLRDITPQASLAYRCVPLHEVVEGEGRQFELVVASEVIEHVSGAAAFLHDICAATKPGGVLVISTMDKSLFTALSFIVVAEHITGVVEPGTHDWAKFIPPADLSRCALNHGVSQIEMRHIVACPDVLKTFASRQLHLSFRLSSRLYTGHYIWAGVKRSTAASAASNIGSNMKSEKDAK
uniref:Coq3p n=1 Tax=Trypanosoma brucei brucei TaxID=5702 RepID=A0A161ABG9_TRYBB|nr:Coq3p [Trypanosoma brucei brucei]